MTRAKARYYLHNLDGLKQEIADINADLEQYRAMSSESFLVNTDPDPYRDAPDATQYFPPEPVDAFSNSVVQPKGGHYNDHSHVETLAVHRADFIAKLEQELFEKKTVLAAINCVLYYLNGYDRQVDKQIIQLRYMEHLPWAVVAKKLYADKDNLRHREQKIIDEIISNYNARLK
jgi:uncharacterized protein (UPF0335 family)